MKRLFVIFSILLITVTSALAQPSLKKGDEAYDQFRYEEAIEYYLKSLPSINNSEVKADVLYRIGYCYLEMRNSFKGEEYLRKALQTNSQALRPEAKMHYADAMRMNGKYEDAIEVYKKYLETVPDDYRAKRGLESCKLVPKWENSQTRYEVENMAYFNSLKHDFAPTWADDDYQLVFFTSSREGSKGTRNNLRIGQKFTDLFQIEQDRKGNWSEPVPLSGFVNTEDDEGASTLTDRGNYLYFTRCKAGDNVDIPCKIFKSKKRGRSWSAGDLFVIPGFEEIEVGYPSLSKDGLIMYFSAKSPRGFGGMDIYYMSREDDRDPFGEPVNIGAPINTAGDEVFPNIRQPGVLYFASDGHIGMGGLDIYRTEMDTAGEWQDPTNMKPPINSSYDDFGIIFYGKKEKGYFSSNREGGKGLDDIYYFKVPPLELAVRGVVKDTSNIRFIRRLKDAEVSLMDESGIVEQTLTGNDGTFFFELEEDKDYILKAKLGEDYFANSAAFTTRNIYKDSTLVVNINLARIPQIIELPNIEYDLDKATLRPESTVALDHLVKTLKDNPHLAIELRAHTDFRGDDEYNTDLSRRRAKSCVDYLIDKGIKSDRLTWKGFGESMPRVIDTTIASKHEFLDPGDILTEGFILEMRSENKRDIAHQLNRRTEFSVKSKTYGLKPGEVPEEDEHKVEKGDAEIQKVGGGEF